VKDTDFDIEFVDSTEVPIGLGESGTPSPHPHSPPRKAVAMSHDESSADHQASVIDAATIGQTREWVECRDCGMFQPLPARIDGHERVCWRCHASFGHGRKAFHPALPLAVTAVILFTVAQSSPLIGIELDGLSQTARIGSGVIGLLDQGLSPLAALVLLVSIAAPLFRVLANSYVLASLYIGRSPAYLSTIFRLSERLRPWAMLDVLLLGVLIALSKLHDLTTVDIGAGFWSLGLLVLTLAVLDSLLDREAVWRALRHAPPALSRPDQSTSISCLACGLINSINQPRQKCIRCHARLFRRKPDSVIRTWALVATGFLLYLPANAYPALTVISFGQSTSATILGGVMELMNGKDWPLALLIFTASVAVPVLKLLGLICLLLSARLGARSHLLDRTRLYRVIEFIGRWSTIDIFVAALLTALVTLGRVATIEPGLGILAFGGVVVTTMFAAESFDPRLMWDAVEVEDG
jgi:paraquat-inducible protein A